MTFATDFTSTVSVRGDQEQNNAKMYRFRFFEICDNNNNNSLILIIKSYAQSV